MTDETGHHQETTEGTAPPRRPLLGLRVAQRRRALPGSGGRRLAEAVAQRPEPAVGPAATRLATARIQRRPSAAAAVRPAPARAAEGLAAPAEPVVDPANEAGSSLSDFAQRWLFGDGEVEGTPVVPRAPPPGTEDAPRPSSGREGAARPPAAERPAGARRQAPPPRGRVLGPSPGGSGLAGRPPVQAEPIQEAPKIEPVET